MDAKEKLYAASCYHIFVGCSVILFVFTQTFDFLSEKAALMAFLLFASIGIVVYYAGYKAIFTNGPAIIVLIIFNALHLVNFNLDHVTYQATVGPFISLDVLSTGIAFSIKADMPFSYSSIASSFEKHLMINLIHIYILMYFLNQLRFIFQEKNSPWEAEYLEQSNEEEVLEHRVC